MRAYSLLIFKILIINVFLLIIIPLQAQHDIEGMWIVDKVVAGNDEMTPVGKWFELKDDETFRSGNGWLQSSSGTYEWNKKIDSLSFYDSLKIADNYGAFHVEISEHSMIWTREEEGMIVMVMASRIDEIPMAPQDYLVGMWELQTDSIESPKVADHIFFRWDRNIRSWKDGSRSGGLWNLNAHRPILLTIVGGEELEWEVEVDAKKLKLKGLSDAIKGIEVNYLRIDHFPN
ncbi:MAG: hypothetical protein CMP59_10580 [Flavobacteriales bacterium]|nr:hypothetical protein [Flavobacteriales bacterium]|tara:strand:+ start:693 stop:1388 length:696 start_codon:yes stop_codon:yes gene_type:complete